MGDCQVCHDTVLAEKKLLWPKWFFNVTEFGHTCDEDSYHMYLLSINMMLVIGHFILLFEHVMSHIEKHGFLYGPLFAVDSYEILDNWHDRVDSVLPIYRELIAAGLRIWVYR